MNFAPKQFYNLERNAVSEIVNRYRYPLTYFACSIVGNVVDAEDVVGEVIVKLLVKKPTLRDERALKSYLYTMTKRTAIDFVRKRKRAQRYEKSVYEERKEDVEEKIVNEQFTQNVFTALNQLEKEQREILYLFYYEDITAEEIAKIVKKNKKFVYNALERGRKKLKSILEKEVESCEE